MDALYIAGIKGSEHSDFVNEAVMEKIEREKNKKWGNTQKRKSLGGGGGE